MGITEVRISGEVHRSGGKRHRAVKLESGERLLEFGVNPVYLDHLPPEIDADEHLLTKEVTAEHVKLAGGTVLELLKLIPERVQDGDPVLQPPPIITAASAAKPAQAKPKKKKRSVKAARKTPAETSPPTEE